MKIVGIIGGFGPDTTSEFILMLIRVWKNKHAGQRPELLIWNSPIDENVEKRFIQENRNHKEFKSLLIKGAKTLEKSGVDFLVLPCNSLHIFIEDIRKSVKIPVLSIIEITTDFLKSKEVERIAILGTEATKKSHLFDRELSTNGIKVTFPKQSDQIVLNSIIHKIVTGKKVLFQGFREIINHIAKRKIKFFLLACTDLQLLNPKVRGVKFIDTLEILARATVEKMSQG